MIVRYVVANEAECDFEQIRSVVNSGQPFFSLQSPVRINLAGLRAADGTPPSADAIGRFLAKNLPDDGTHSQTVLITSREIGDLASLRSGDFFQIVSTHDLIGISNYRSSLTGEASDHAFVRRIVHAVMQACVNFKIKDVYCVCGNGDDFVYLSRQAQAELRSLDYRDGISDLLQFVNWLNQIKGNPKQPTIRKPRTSGLPLVEHFTQRILKGRRPPFTNKVVLMVLHFLSDLMPFVENVVKLGAKPTDIYLVAKPYPYPARDKISHELELMGIRVNRATEQSGVSEKATEVLNALHQRKDISTKELIVIEDGGYFSPLLHRSKNAPLLKRCVGIVEQTSKGIWETERQVDKTNVKVPVLSVARSNFKERYESPEIGRATVQNISRFVSNIKLSGRRAVVFGFGSIGMYIAENLNRTFNMGVSVVDKSAEKRLFANHRKDIVTEAKGRFEELAHKGDTILVVGTTGGGEEGTPSVTIELMKNHLPDGTILASTSSDRIEFDVAGLKRLAVDTEDIEEGNTRYTIKVNGKTKSLFLLAEGYPINFYGSDSVPNDTIDPIMALLLLSAVSICQDPKAFKRGIDSERVNKLMGTDGWNVAAEYAAITARVRSVTR